MFENYFYSMESDNDDIELDPKVTTNDETAVDEAGDDMETVDVSPDTKETAHNEEASAGGISTGDNQDDLEMDPVAATENYLFKKFHMSSEDVDEIVVNNIAESENIEPFETFPEENIDPDVAAGIVIPDNNDTELETSEDTVVSSDEVSTENLIQSTEKAYGYFKLNDFKKNPADKRSNERPSYNFSSPKEFLNSELGKSKIKQLINDAKDRDMTPATMNEVNDLKPTFFHKFIRLNSDTLPIFKYYSVGGVVFATWKTPSIKSRGLSLHAVGLFKTKTGKITSIGYAISVPCGVNLSTESYNRFSTESLFNF